jgi:hypothetical protein
MLKFLGEFSTNITLLAVTQDDTLINALAELQNVVVIILVRVLWVLGEKLYNRYFKPIEKQP